MRRINRWWKDRPREMILCIISLALLGRTAWVFRYSVLPRETPDHAARRWMQQFLTSDAEDLYGDVHVADRDLDGTSPEQFRALCRWYANTLKPYRAEGPLDIQPVSFGQGVSATQMLTTKDGGKSAIALQVIATQDGPEFYLATIVDSGLTNLYYSKFADQPNNLRNAMTIREGLQREIAVLTQFCRYGTVSTDPTEPKLQSWAQRSKFAEKAVAFYEKQRQEDLAKLKP